MTPLRVTGRDRQRAFARGFMAAAASHDPRVRARQARPMGMGEGVTEDLALVEPVADEDLFTA